MNNYVNLHNHTVFSFLDGHSKPDRYTRLVNQYGQPAATIADHGNICGWLDFYDACIAQDVKPILGIEAYQARKTRFDRDDEERAGPANHEWEQRGPYHLILLAQNIAGYKNIIKISSRAFLEGYYVKPRLDLDLLSEHSEGVIALSACLNGQVQQALLRDDYNAAITNAAKMQDIVGKDNYYIEIQDHGLEEQQRVKQDTLKIAQAIGARVVATCDSHYVHKAESYHHDVMLCVGTKSLVDQEKRLRFKPDQFYLKSYDEMAAIFEPEWLSNTLYVAESIDLKLNFGELYFPDYPLPEGRELNEFLEELVWEGAKKRYSDHIPEEVIDRINHELRVIKKMGFQSYFLVVWDLVKWAKDNGIRCGWGRGSAAGSILSYCLGITNLDPIEFRLLFDRFLVEGRKSLPDIDLDFDDRYRNRVIDYARSKYGADHVSNIATFSRVGARSAIRDSAKVLGYDYLTGDKLANLVPPPSLGVAKTLDQAMATPEMIEAYEGKAGKHIIDTARGLEGIVRQPGIHPAGVVIAKNPTTDYVPLMLGGGKKKNIVVTQWDMDRVEENGLLKIDFLGLRNLGVIDECVRNIKKFRDEDIDVYTLPLDDDTTYTQLRKGDAIGLFQIEGSGIRDMMSSLQPENIEDIMALIALYRPGPMGSGMDRMYINRKHGKEKIETLHPSVTQVLEPSYGIMLYQEDVLAVARILAGFSPGLADDLRKAIGKKQMDKIGKFRQEFIRGCKEVSGVPESVSDKLYSAIEYHGGYSFNRSHSASYAMISYTTAYLKNKFPAEYMAALLSTVTDDKDKMRLYLSECRKMNLKVLPPNITDPNYQFTVRTEGEICFGFSAIEQIGPAFYEALKTKQTYDSVWDFMRRCDEIILLPAKFEQLMKAGCFDVLAPEKMQYTSKTKMELLEQEKDVLGIYVTDHPLLDIWDTLKRSTTHSINDLDSLKDGYGVKLAGIITSMSSTVTRAGKKLVKFFIEDLTGEIEVVVFPKAVASMPEDYLTEGSIGILDGNLSREGSEENPTLKIFFSSFNKTDISILYGNKPIILTPKQKLTEKQLMRIYDIIERVDGDTYVYLEYPEGNHTVTLKFTKPTSPDIEKALQDIVSLSIFKVV